ncbi:hypothetical protein TEA_023396 [Camellia sinensis var. sinensis]|uniref:Uncharacterized protein n=1 Tax=Camellia sinensis var. sinensis TaxID=542762 RepID=A0A4S4E6Q4_CAMSN|nr:hypothetical protein TEA_023396 [Camellia sinensis var. sinensis]
MFWVSVPPPFKGIPFFLISSDWKSVCDSKSLTLWDVVKGEKIEHTNLQQALLQACVCLLSSAPLIVDLNTGTTTVLPVSLPEMVTVHNKLSDGSACCTPTSACFNNYGDMVYVGNSEGEILVIDHKMLRVHGVVPISAAPCFSGDGEWVVGGSANKGEHKIHIWDRTGRLVKILEAPKEALIDLAWHPVHSFVVSVSLTGLVYIWAKDYIENWSAFATDFKELEGNEEYVEREDEFDLMLVTEKVGEESLSWVTFPLFYVFASIMCAYLQVKESDVDEDNEVDIMTVEKDSVFSDSDMSQEEICFPAANLCHDVPMQQDKCIESSSKLVNSNHSGSPLYVEAGRNGHSPNHASSPSKAPCFSGDGEWVVGGSANKGEHKIHIWDRTGRLVKILEAPKEALIDLAWHPVHSFVVSVSLTGLVYIWAKDYIENWSAFATDFKELEGNEEYVEREDEFDLMLVTEKVGEESLSWVTFPLFYVFASIMCAYLQVKESDVDEDDEVDIMTVEKDSVFSDSDMSQEEICFPAANLCHDVPMQQDKCIESSSKLVNSNHSGSPLYVEAGRNGHSPNHASSPSKGKIMPCYTRRSVSCILNAIFKE